MRSTKLLALPPVRGVSLRGFHVLATSLSACEAAFVPFIARCFDKRFCNRRLLILSAGTSGPTPLDVAVVNLYVAWKSDSNFEGATGSGESINSSRFRGVNQLVARGESHR